MICRSALLVGFALSLVTFAGPAVTSAQQPASGAVEPKAETPSKPSSEQIARWVKQLDDDAFATRQAAHQKLESAGAAAIDALRHAAVGDSHEASVRAIDILKNHFHGENKALKQSAEAALKSIAEGDQTGAARRATNALKDEPKKVADEQPPAIGPGGIQIGPGGRIQLRVQAIQVGGKGAKRISVKNVNGTKEIDVEEDGRKINIEETAEGKIKMKVTEKKDGKEETKSYEADSADDLKKIHPNAHKIYEKYKNGGGGGIRIRAIGPGGIKIAPGGIPRALPAPGGAKRIKDARKRLEEARKRLEKDREKQLPADPAQRIDDAIERLEGSRRELGDDQDAAREAIQKAIDELHRAKKQLEKAADE